MTKFALSGCRKLTSNGMQHLPKLRDMAKLTRSGCRKPIDNGVQH